MKQQIQGWFHRESIGGEYYTHQPNVKTRHLVGGSGDAPPTPNELLDVFDKHPNANLMHGGQILQEYDYKLTEEIPVELPAGCYKHFPSTHPDQPEALMPIDLRDDNLVKMPGITRQIVLDVRTFLQNEKVYRDIGIQYRRGILLYGPPGQGKTTMLREIIKDEVPEDSIIIFLSELPSLSLIKKIQEEERDRLKVIIFEELTSIVGRHDRDIEGILDFLDGESSLDRALLFGTTNYPELLPGNIVNRPSRFDRLIKVDNPNKKTRKKLLEFYLCRKPTSKEVDSTDDMSVAAIKEASILSRLYRVPVEEAVDHLKEMRQIVENDFEEGAVGLNRPRKRHFLDFDDEDY